MKILAVCTDATEWQPLGDVTCLSLDDALTTPRGRLTSPPHRMAVMGVATPSLVKRIIKSYGIVVLVLKVPQHCWAAWCDDIARMAKQFDVGVVVHNLLLHDSGLHASMHAHPCVCRVKVAHHFVGAPCSMQQRACLDNTLALMRREFKIGARVQYIHLEGGAVSMLIEQEKGVTLQIDLRWPVTTPTVIVTITTEEYGTHVQKHNPEAAFGELALNLKNLLTTTNTMRNSITLSEMQLVRKVRLTQRD